MLVICQLTQRSYDPPASPPAMYRLPGVPFDPVHFTEYPLKPEYNDYTAKNILARDHLARTTELTNTTKRALDMGPPVTPKPMSASAAELSMDHTNKPFGIIYNTLTGVIDTIVPATGLWFWMDKSMSYLIKLAPILWWALLTQSATHQFPNASKLADQSWFPDSIIDYSLNKAQVKHLDERIK
ncbi:hypothetical protein DSO57_1037052 [Entomophthora muscae]|uniref:Uncharacterized protein n=1 Tax=Entomophthora muscae TaxID=34485 RepID=A0ACC2SBU2_9FUNG|nr:hypothetical protein DSO57_1037052 [Entomophthora muscae]